MEAPNHYIENSDLTIYQMILNRLPFLADTEANEKLLSSFTLEVMFELEVCFNVDEGNPEPTHIGNEEYYSFLQRSIIADIVCCYVLMVRTIGTTVGVEGSEAGKFMSKAKAGSVEVEWEQFDTKKGGMVTSADNMLTMYKKLAQRKARQLGCIIDICDDCTVAAQLEATDMMLPLRVVVESCGCGCGPKIIERG